MLAEPRSAASQVPLGQAIPSNQLHAVSVSLPRWQDNVDYEEGTPRVLEVMETGYPRFFVHKTIKELAARCEALYSNEHDECCFIYPTRRVADSCVRFLAQRRPPVVARIVDVELVDRGDEASGASDAFHAVFMPKTAYAVGKQYWQHTGDGVSSRFAAHCLQHLSERPHAGPSSPAAAVDNVASMSRALAKNRHYATPASVPDQVDGANGDAAPSAPVNGVPETWVYVEERYGRNLTAASAEKAKQAVRRRIAGVLQADEIDTRTAALAPSTRGVSELTEDDVFLYPCGMSAIYHAHLAALTYRTSSDVQPGKSVCFGFPYTDTLKILEKWGPGCIHYGHGVDSDIDDFEQFLAEQATSSMAPVISLFCEFPSNPLLRSPNLQRLRHLADRYNFLIVVDETIGTFHSVEVLPFADMVVSSLTKVFSGDANVMGGSLVLNPRSRHYAALKAVVVGDHEEVLWREDAVFLERNSRDFQARINRIDATAEYLCDRLSDYAATSRALKAVYYPKYITPDLYRQCAKRQESAGTVRWGGLFSLTFNSRRAAQTCYDALPCYKGPSLGTNFTLASPYTLLAHYAELDWAAQWGVESTLIRVSVGLEDGDSLWQGFHRALCAAETHV